MTRMLRRILPSGLGGLAGLACALCCVVPVLLVALVLSGAGWAWFGRILPGIAVLLAAATGLAWWWARRRPAPATECSGDDGACACGAA